MEENKEIENLQAELRVLRSELLANTSPCGDWRMAKAMENLLIGLNKCEEANIAKFVKDWATETYSLIGEQINDRVAKRERVNEIEEELKELA